MCVVCNVKAGYRSYPDTYTHDRTWHCCNECSSKWFTMNKDAKKMTRIDLTPRNLTVPIEPITFFNHISEVEITDEDIRILRDVEKLHRYASLPVDQSMSLKILKIRIIKNTHNTTLKFAKDIVEYLDNTLLKG